MPSECKPPEYKPPPNISPPKNAYETLWAQGLYSGFSGMQIRGYPCLLLSDSDISMVTDNQTNLRFPPCICVGAMFSLFVPYLLARVIKEVDTRAEFLSYIFASYSQIVYICFWNFLNSKLRVFRGCLITQINPKSRKQPLIPVQIQLFTIITTHEIVKGTLRIG